MSAQPHPGRIIAGVLRSKQMTQTELADRIGRSLKHVNLLVNGKARLSTEVALAIAEVLRMDPSALARMQADYDVEQRQNRGDA